MTEAVLELDDDPAPAVLPRPNPAPPNQRGFLGGGRDALVVANRELGLALSEDKSTICSTASSVWNATPPTWN